MSTYPKGRFDFNLSDIEFGDCQHKKNLSHQLFACRKLYFETNEIKNFVSNIWIVDSEPIIDS